MSIVIQQGWYRILGLCLAGIGGLAVLAIAARDVPRGAPYQVRVVAENMRFFRAEDPATANPTLALPTDRRIEIVFRNEDAGASHRLALPELERETPLLASGESAVLRLGPLKRSQTLAYVCDLHPVTMRGAVRVGTSSPP